MAIRPVHIIGAIGMGLLLTAYLEPLQVQVLKPVRNLIYFGKLSNQTFEGRIPKLHYRDGTVAINPVNVALEIREDALATLRGREPEQETAEAILEIADFFHRSADLIDVGGKAAARWSYSFPLRQYGLDPPWYSGMAQGHAIEALLAGFEISGDQQYLQTALLAGHLFRIDVGSGGVAVERPVGTWFAEYAKAGLPAPRVLNGHIFALEGIRELAKYDPEFTSLFEAGVDAVRADLPLYDRVLWTSYDTTGIPASHFYQRVHVRQMNQLHTWTRDPLFSDYRRRFQRQMLSPLGPAYRILVFPSRFLGLLITLNSLVSLLLILLLARARRASVDARP